jgi:predicted transcriptional regulator
MYPVNQHLLFTDEEMEKMKIKYPLQVLRQELIVRKSKNVNAGTYPVDPKKFNLDGLENKH